MFTIWRLLRAILDVVVANGKRLASIEAKQDEANKMLSEIRETLIPEQAVSLTLVAGEVEEQQ